MNESLRAETATLEEASSRLVAAALNAGAESAEVCASFSQKTRIGLEKQDYHLASSDAGFHLGLRVLKAGKQGFAAGNSTDSKDLKLIANRAVEIANFSPENPHYRILANQNVSNSARYPLWDDALANLSLKTQQDWTKILADEAMRDARFRLNEASVEIGNSLFLIQNSLGTLKREHETHATWTLMGMAVDGDKITSFDYFSGLSRKAAGTPDRIFRSVQSFCKGVVDTLHQAPAKNYQGKVVFSPRAVSEIFLQGLSYHLNGRVVGDGLSKWKPADIGKRILNPNLTLKDLPTVRDRWGTTFFDREGVPTSDRTVIEKGVLRGLFLDSYAAHTTGLQSTGNAIGGPTSLPSVGPHTLCLGAGDTAKDALYATAATSRDEFLVVHRFSGQVDPVTGDFSGVAKGAEWWKGNERQFFATETLISGNLFQALGHDFLAASLETEIVDSGTESPTILCDGISVTSGKASA